MSGLRALRAPILAGLLTATAGGQAESEQAPADAVAGRQVFLDRELGHCLLCHQVAQIDAPFQGTIGPDLSDIGRRLDAPRLRARIADPLAMHPDSVMPAYARTEGLYRVAARHRGQPILTPRQIDDVVAFLLTLCTPAAACAPQGEVADAESNDDG